MPQHTCLVFHVDCGTMVKGILAVAMAFTLFIGSVYLLLSAVFGRWMGYLIVAVSFFGWMMIMSSLWFFGFFAQGPTTPRFQGPRGSEPAWVVLSAGLQITSPQYDTFSSYPNGPWKEPGPALAASIQSVSSTVQTFLAQQANAQLHLDPLAPNAVQNTQFVVEDIKFAPDGKVSLAVARASFTGGGPEIVLTLRHDSGSVPRYSAMFLLGSIALFAVHLPLLDRAEKKRKEFLTGGAAPAWYGPA